jgi:hypothetical protein
MSTAMVLAWIVFVALFKLGLIMHWTKRLHDKYADRYSYSEVFRMMFAPQPRSKFDADFWNDFAPIEKWNRLSNLFIAGLTFVGFSTAVTVAHIMR